MMNQINLFDDKYFSRERDRVYSTPMADYVIKRKSTMKGARKNKTRKELLDWLNIKDPFGEYEILESWPFDPNGSIIKQLESIIEYFSQLKSVRGYIEDYANGKVEWIGGGASRKVFKSLNHPVVYKVSALDCLQSIKAIRCWVETTNPFLIPVLGVFKHHDQTTNQENLILVKPLVDKDNDNYTRGICTVPEKIEYIRNLTGQIESCWMNEGEFTFFDGCMMYRGSNNWVWHHDVPVWFDLGEVLLNEASSRLDEPFWNYLQQFKV